MHLNLNDPDSIVRWWTVLPDRHDDYLAYKVQISPEFAPNITEARRRIADSQIWPVWWRKSCNSAGTTKLYKPSARTA